MKNHKDKNQIGKTKPVKHPVHQELINKIIEAREAAKSASSHAKGIEKDMQSVIDEANVTIPLIPFIKPQYAEGLMNTWNLTEQQASRINSNLGNIQDDSSGTVSTSSTTSFSISGAYLNDGLYTGESGFVEAWQPFIIFGSKPELRSEVEQLLQDYGFDKASFKGEKSPLENFTIAHEAFDKPITEDNPVSTSSIPLRECIKTVIEELLKFRPVQEEAKNEKNKILSIGKQLGTENLPEEVISEWADEWHDLNHGDLSRSKRKTVEREDWLIELNRGTSFLRSLLRGIDANKFRK